MPPLDQLLHPAANDLFVDNENANVAEARQCIVPVNRAMDNNVVDVVAMNVNNNDHERRRRYFAELDVLAEEAHARFVQERPDIIQLINQLRRYRETENAPNRRNIRLTNQEKVYMVTFCLFDNGDVYCIFMHNCCKIQVSRFNIS